MSVGSEVSVILEVDSQAAAFLGLVGEGRRRSSQQQCAQQAETAMEPSGWAVV
jgi:hypothetical protein